MTSIHTNVTAKSALNTLRSISGNLEEEQRRISSGLRVQTASDNGAYWSISTTMRSDGKALSATSDALGLGAAIVDTAYSGLESVIDVLDKFKSRLVAAREAGVDKSKVQAELEQLKEQVVSIAQSANFARQNWLKTDIADIYDDDLTRTSLVSSFTRDAANNVAVKTLDFYVSDVALFNSTGGGLLQKDARDMSTIGGIRMLETSWDGDQYQEEWVPRSNAGYPGVLGFSFNGPLTFDDASDQITFDVTVDADNPANVPAPYDPGQTTSIVIDQATVAAVNPGLNGVISTNTQYAAVLNYALGQANADAHVYANYGMWDASHHWIHDPAAMAFWTNESSGLDGSYVEVSNFNSTVGSGGLGDASDFGERGSAMSLTFQPFVVFEDGNDPNGVRVSLNFSVNGAVAKSYSFDRTYVNDLLGRDTGKVETSDEMVTLLQSLLGNDWPDVIIEVADPSDPLSNITIKSDEAADRLSGGKTKIGFANVDVSIEPLSTLNFEDIDVARNPAMVDTYIRYLDTALSKIIDGTAKLGALKSRIDMQTSFNQAMLETIDKGVGRLVDNDMDASSARLKALQTQQQLGLQALHIANGEPENILRLFQ